VYGLPEEGGSMSEYQANYILGIREQDRQELDLELQLVADNQTPDYIKAWEEKCNESADQLNF